eukprot:CAMPEP_0184503866 /NCGR_PEP_ID=MMETSP0113_2-20130426/52141_1 /TAXON_ID=91329 /ORGANISM="Norrisiella sphaerica, Strain BC52" /LENGTH=220 /DNA_ID=CAMNT_0026893435 /DNA_START=146 /DNA_END=808 /DNA_ORIENTATION=-
MKSDDCSPSETTHMNALLSYQIADANSPSETSDLYARTSFPTRKGYYTLRSNALRSYPTRKGHYTLWSNALRSYSTRKGLSADDSPPSEAVQLIALLSYQVTDASSPNETSLLCARTSFSTRKGVYTQLSNALDDPSNRAITYHMRLDEVMIQAELCNAYDAIQEAITCNEYETAKRRYSELRDKHKDLADRNALPLQGPSSSGEENGRRRKRKNGNGGA